MTDRERQKRCRERRRRGLVPHRIDIGEDVLNTLEYLGWLKPESMTDPRAMRAALTRMSADWARLRNPFLT